MKILNFFWTTRSPQAYALSFAQINMLTMFCALLVGGISFAQENPYKDTPVDRAESSIVKEFDRFIFLESVLSAADGSIYTTSAMEGKLYKIKEGETRLLMDIEGILVCIAAIDDNNILITGTTGKQEQVVYQVDDKGTYKIIAKFPEAQHLNGITRLKDTIYLIADSNKGAIWKLDISDGSVSMWLKHDLLERPSPEEPYPGVNGIKVFKNTVYISNTTKFLMAKIPVLDDGAAGQLEVTKGGVFLDDFTFDKEGNIYAATHMFSVVKITQTGEVSIIAQSDQGITGCTYVTWKYGSDDTLLVATDGGWFSPIKSDVVPAKIVQIKI